MTTGFFAVPCAEALPPRVAANATAATRTTPSATTTILERFIELPSVIGAPDRHSRTLLRLRGLLGFHEAVERRLQRGVDALLLGLPDQRAVDRLDLGRAVSLDVLEHRRVVPAAPFGRMDVHLPRVLVESDACRPRYPLAFLDEVVDEEAEVTRLLAGGEVRVVREAGKRGHGVHGRVEDQLRPLRWAEVFERPRLQAGGDDQLGRLLDERVRGFAIRSKPRLGVEDVLDVRVRVACAAHEGDRRDHPSAGEELLGTEPVLHCHHRRAWPVAGKPLRNGWELGSLGRDDRKLGLGQLGRVGRGLQARGDVTPPGDAQALIVERAGVLLPPREHRDLADAGEMAGVEAADHAGADYADALDTALRSRSTPREASSRGSSRQSDPSSSASEKISRS